MRQARAVPLPNETLHIEEIKFWLKMMQDHTQFIYSGLPSDCKDFIDASKEFHKAFCSVLQKAEKLKSVKQSGNFIQEITSIMEEFCSYQKQILAERLSGKIGGSHFPFFIDHLLREARCFTAFLQRMQEVKTMGKSVSHTKEVVVWLRFMSDHTKLMAQYLDPSEYHMRKIACDFSTNFDQLVLQARCLSSMLYCQRSEVRAFHRFLLDARLEVQKLRDFHKTAEELIADCRLLGIATVELATHMRREAEHCLLMIALMEKELIKHRPDEFYDDIDNDVWVDTDRAEDEENCLKEQPKNQEVAVTPLKVSDMDMEEKSVDAPIIENVESAVENRTMITAEPSVVEEPVVAILSVADRVPIKDKNDKLPTNLVVTAAPKVVEKEAVLIAESKSAEDVAERLIAAEVAQVEESIDLPKPNMPSEIKIQPEEKAQKVAAGLVSKRERIYAKASDYKIMPGKLAGASPGERCINQQKGLQLPRPLGKKK